MSVMRSTSSPTTRSTDRLVGIRAAMSDMLRRLALPLVGIGAFLLLWSAGAGRVDTSLGKFPGPMAVWEQAGKLHDEYFVERQKEAEFHARQQARNAQRLAEDPSYEVRIRPYTGKATFPDQVATSLATVLSGFVVAAVLAIPLGIIIGLNRSLNQAFNPLIQLFKPVSPLAWLPLVTMVVSALYTSEDPLVPKSFINSLITVSLCCLWPMVINTAVGVAAVPQDLVNVSRVLSLSPLAHVRTIVLPSAIPMIFTGMRLSLGIAWMVLIAAEMLAQNPGLGKFVWDEFQNGSSDSLGRIMVAVLAIGAIGFLLDRGMLQVQRLVSWDKSVTLR